MAQSIPFMVITLALIAGEVVKQIISYKQEGGYDFWHLPLHFCSTYFLWFALAEFSFGRMRQTMQNIAFVATLYLCFGFYIFPTGVLGESCEHVFESYFTAHTFFYHHLVILYMMLSIAFKRFAPKAIDALVWVVCFSAYFAVAAVCAYRFEQNFFNILNSESLSIFEPIRLHVGQVIYNAGLAFVLLFFGSTILLVSSWIRKRHLQEEEASVEELVEIQ